MTEPLERVAAIARRLLTIEQPGGGCDVWLWEHSERVMRLAQAIRALPEVADQAVDELGLSAAALFHDAGWAVQARQGRVGRWQLLARPTNDVQRELGAALLQEEAAHILPGESAVRAVEAIRQCNFRHAASIEAQVLAEAENLDDVGVMYVVRQLRMYQAEGRPLEQLVTSWTRQREYKYWEARVNDGFRFESTRGLARERIARVDRFMSALSAEQAGDDLAHLLAERAESLPAG